MDKKARAARKPKTALGELPNLNGNANAKVILLNMETPPTSSKPLRRPEPRKPDA